MAARVAPAAGLPAKTVPVPPNQTLYVTNLPSSKIQKEDLRTALYMLFSTYGAVLDVVALKTQKMRGQAHVVYRDVQTATQAMRSLDGFEFFGREMVRLPRLDARAWAISGLTNFTENLVRKVQVEHNCEAGWYLPATQRGVDPSRSDRSAAEHLQRSCAGRRAGCRIP